MKSERWRLAQKYEKEWWASRQDHIDFDFYRHYAADLVNQMEPFLAIGPGTSVLEIGSGAGGIITFLNASERQAIDPLEDFYASVPAFQAQRDPRVLYQKAKAERLPFEDNRFDLVICDNVLDHCDDVQAALKEMRRVLTEDGKIYLRVNIYTAWGKIIRLLAETLQIDPGHPHTFTTTSLNKYFNRCGLQVVKSAANGFFTSWIKELRSGAVKEWLKALTFSSPNKTMFLLAHADKG
ncbi:MAG TPA: class I SAM-dependent methyltransferase [bacterium]|nr:class I SAM-dependent methyltransferase [bacterium]HPN33074.1 class I SAM-dependent methyltransferase [bacterium]